MQQNTVQYNAVHTCIEFPAVAMYIRRGQHSSLTLSTLTPP